MMTTCLWPTNYNNQYGYVLTLWARTLCCICIVLTICTMFGCAHVTCLTLITISKWQNLTSNLWDQIVRAKTHFSKCLTSMHSQSGLTRHIKMRTFLLCIATGHVERDGERVGKMKGVFFFFSTWTFVWNQNENPHATIYARNRQKLFVLQKKHTKNAFVQRPFDPVCLFNGVLKSCYLTRSCEVGHIEFICPPKKSYLSARIIAGFLQANLLIFCSLTTSGIPTLDFLNDCTIFTVKLPKNLSLNAFKQKRREIDQHLSKCGFTARLWLVETFWAAKANFSKFKPPLSCHLDFRFRNDQTILAEYFETAKLLWNSFKSAKILNYPLRDLLRLANQRAAFIWVKPPTGARSRCAIESRARSATSLLDFWSKSFNLWPF